VLFVKDMTKNWWRTSTNLIRRITTNDLLQASTYETHTGLIFKDTGRLNQFVRDFV